MQEEDTGDAVTSQVTMDAVTSHVTMGSRDRELGREFE